MKGISYMFVFVARRRLNKKKTGRGIWNADDDGKDERNICDDLFFVYLAIRYDESNNSLMDEWSKYRQCRWYWFTTKNLMDSKLSS